MSSYEKTMGVRYTDLQRRLWEAAAARDHRRLTDWIRLKLDQAALAELPPEEQEKAAKPKRRPRRR